MTLRRTLWFPMIGTVAAHPRLWPTAARQLGRAIPPSWWRQRPFVPWPDSAYARFRAETAFGTDGVPTPAQITSYLEWCRETDRAVRATRVRSAARPR